MERRNSCKLPIFSCIFNYFIIKP